MDRILSETIDFDDIRLVYSQCGSGPDLLLLHGNGECKTIFNRYQTEYFPGHHTWALDSRGHGESRSNDNRITIEQISDDVLRFCEAKGIKSAAVIGYSDGGNIALWLAKKAPRLFSKIIAISPNTLARGINPDLLIKYRILSWFMKFLSWLGFNFRNQVMIIDLMLHDIGLSFEDLKSIKTKVKIIYAEKEMIKEDHIKDIAAAIPGCELEKVMGCTHLSILRSPEAVRIMQEYLIDSK